MRALHDYEEEELRVSILYAIIILSEVVRAALHMVGAFDDLAFTNYVSPKGTSPHN